MTTLEIRFIAFTILVAMFMWLGVLHDTAWVTILSLVSWLIVVFLMFVFGGGE